MSSVVRAAVRAAALVGAAAAASAAFIAGDAALDLGSAGGAAAWSAASSDGTLLAAVRVPGDVISALAEGGVIADPWRDLTWRDEAARWDLAAWSLVAAFASPPWAAAGGSTLLVLDSVKMAADVVFNGRALGAATSQHLRYTWDVSALLLPGGGDNVLNVTFPPTVSDTRNDAGRFQGCSGGWDWAPYSNETTGRTPKGIRTLSKGVVGPAYLVHAPPGGALITAVKPLVHFTGSYPVAPLPADGGPVASWRVDVLVYLLAPAGAPAGAPLRVAPSWAAAAATTVPAPALLPGVETPVNVSLVVPPGVVALWWPNTVAGARPLYAVAATLGPAAPGGAAVSASAVVGFRTLALVTADDSDPSSLAGVRGSGNLTFRLKVNGADVSVRGANWIPLEELASRWNASSEAAAVVSAASAGMSMLRVWGGGVYPSDALLRAADEAGVLLYIDAMYASQADSHHFAADTPEQRAELAHNVRRLAAHPSVALYDQCNECGGSGDFAAFVGPAIAAEDPTRPLWPSSPSAGWADGVDRLWGTPLGAGANLTIRTAPDTPVAPVGGCVGQGGAFYYGFPLTPFLAPLPVADAPACCALCAATPGCAVGNFAGGGCQLVGPPAAAAHAAPDSLALFPPGSPLAPQPVPVPVAAEVHGPYLGGGGWPTVNGGGPPARAYDAALPPALAASPSAAYGPRAPGVFTSEFGVGQPASFELMAPSLSPQFWSMHGGDHPADNCTGGFAHVCTGGNVMAQRNYGCDDAWATYFPAGMTVSLDGAGAAPFSAQLYLCQLATALALQSAVEVQRASNRWGVLTWQLGEVWPTYGWGSLEYSSGPGAATGGRWKPSHYALARAYGNVAAACGADGACYVKNDDALAPLAADVAVDAVPLAGGAPVRLGGAPVSLARGANAVAWLCASGGGPPPCTGWPAALTAAGCGGPTGCAVTVTVTPAGGGPPLASTTQLLAPPGVLNASRAVTVSAAVGAADPTDGSVPVTLTVAGGGGAPVLYVTLFTSADGRFSDNFLPLLPAPGTTLRFLPAAPGQAAVLAATLRVSWLNALLPPPRPATGTCTTREDTDVSDAGAFVEGATLDACCAACWADPSRRCLASAFNPAAPGCWLKYGTDYVPRPGVRTCTLDL